MIILKYNSPETQNKVLEIIGLQVLREIAQNVQNSVCNNGRWISIKEQPVFCIRRVDENLIPHEEFIGVHTLENTNANHIDLVIKDILMPMNLKLEWYEGSAMMETLQWLAQNLELQVN